MKPLSNDQEEVSAEERFKAFSCMMIWLIMIGLYAVAGIVSYQVMSPKGFIESFLWIIAWNILAAILEMVFAAIVMRISEMDI